MSAKPRVITVVSAFVALVAATGCDRTTPPGGGHPIPLSMAALKNAEYVSDAFRSRFQLHDGEYKADGDHAMLTDRVAFGALNGDGVDAAVVFELDGGGSGNWLELAVVLNDHGRPLNVATVDLGDRVIVQSLQINTGQIVIELVEHSSDDPLCCPTVKVKRTYELANGRLRLMSVLRD